MNFTFFLNVFFYLWDEPLYFLLKYGRRAPVLDCIFSQTSGGHENPFYLLFFLAPLLPSGLRSDVFHCNFRGYKISKRSVCVSSWRDVFSLHGSTTSWLPCQQSTSPFIIIIFTAYSVILHCWASFPYFVKFLFLFKSLENKKKERIVILYLNLQLNNNNK